MATRGFYKVMVEHASQKCFHSTKNAVQKLSKTPKNNIALMVDIVSICELFHHKMIEQYHRIE